MNCLDTRIKYFTFNKETNQSMARAMFEYTKTVLKKVSFSVDLFSRELQKALTRLLPFEIDELRLWLISYTKQKPELVICLTMINE